MKHARSITSSLSRKFPEPHINSQLECMKIIDPRDLINVIVSF